MNLSIFYRVSVYYLFCFLVPNGIGSALLSDIVQSSLVNHHKPWFQQEDQTCKLLSTTGSLGITNTCTKPAPYIIIYYYTNFQSSTKLTRPRVLQWFFSILEPRFVIPKGAPILEPSNLRICKSEAGSQKCCKDLANTRLDLRNAANSLQIEGKGCYLGIHTMEGVAARNTEHERMDGWIDR